MESLVTNRNIEVIALAILALMLAATMQVGLVWLGVVVAYVAYLHACNVRFVAVTNRKGYTLISCNVSSKLSLCVVVRQTVAPQYNVWQLGYAK